MRAKSPVCLWMATFNGPKVFRRLTPFKVLMNWQDNICLKTPISWLLWHSRDQFYTK